MPNENREQKLDGVELLKSDRPTVTSGQAAAILGFSRWTFSRRRNMGYYTDIGRCMVRSGWLYDMENVIRTGYPSADDAKVAELMKEYRDRFMAARRRRAR